ncbi:HlyD family secretion protein [Rugamonas sp.]|uniref:HlyD family secretion protein n=1 Tax=Rugamonas sp. TaxID=1926287 RepID=UPI0025FC482E|nr:HlyD family secretion protein [Rugamonas sp.]
MANNSPVQSAQSDPHHAPDAGGPAPIAPTSHRQQWLSGLGFGAVALAGMLIVLYAWRLPPFSSPVISTENALVRGQVTLIGTQLSGYVVDVKVTDFQYVKQGDLLVLIDARTFQQRYDQAQAQLESQQATLANWEQQRRSAEQSIVLAQATLDNAQAQGVKARADLGRVDHLVADGSLSVREQDQVKAVHAQMAASLAQARAGLEIARQNLQSVIVNRAALIANVGNAQAVLKAARVDLDNTRVTAPCDGQLGQVTVRRGAYVNSGAQLMGLVPQQMWIIANFKETQMNDVRVGQRAPFTVDALGGAMLNGEVEYISPATGS